MAIPAVAKFVFVFVLSSFGILTRGLCSENVTASVESVYCAT